MTFPFHNWSQSEHMENMPPESRMWFFMNFTSGVFSRQKKNHVYIIIHFITDMIQNVCRNFVRVGQKAVFVFVLSWRGYS